MIDFNTFIVDFLFYSVIEGVLFLYIRDAVKNNKSFDFGNKIGYAILISFFMCILSYSIPNRFIYNISLILMLTVFYIFLLKDDIKTSFKCGFICIVYLFSLESVLVVIMRYCGFDVTRVLVFIFIKSVQFIFVFVWREFLMKLMVGKVVRR